MRSTRSLIATAVAMFLSGTVIALTPGAAHAADAYRYWAYFTVTDGAFVAQDTGPAGSDPVDGSVEGYRYAAPADFTRPNLPRADLSEVNFDTVCADVAAVEGKKRIAVVVDFGVEQDAADGATVPQPRAWCAVAPADANGLQVLQEVAPKIRTEEGSYGAMLCGIEGYPTTGCGADIAEQATPADDAPVSFTMPGDAVAGDEDEESNLPLLIGVGAAVVVLGAGGVFLARRRAAADHEA